MEKEQSEYYKIEGEYCPACLLGQIIKRTGPHSAFLACNRYPQCNFISIAKPKLSPCEKLDREADEWLEAHNQDK